MIILGQRFSCKQLSLLAVFIYLLILLTKLYHYISPNAYGEFKAYLELDDVKELFRAGKDTGVTITLWDPLILQAWKSNEYLVTSKECLFLCHVIGPLFFTVTETELKGKAYFLSRLAQLGFTVTQFFSQDGRRTHIFLVRQGSPLHLNILHWSDAGYWRQHQLHGPAHHMALVKQFITVESWNVLNMDRAYERINGEEAEIDGIMLTVPSDVDEFVSDYMNARFIPCNVTRANYFYSKYAEDVSAESKKFQHLAWKSLAKSKTILDDLEVPFWISSGTLLGFFRECKIIPWSMDVDLGIFIEDYSTALISKFESTGMKLVAQFGKIEDSLELSFKENGMKVDLFFFYTEGASMWNGGTQAKSGKKFKYFFPNFTLCWTEFLDLKVRIPCQTEDYIEANYGKNWFVPVKHWDWKSSPPNVIENGIWPEDELEKVIILKD